MQVSSRSVEKLPPPWLAGSPLNLAIEGPLLLHRSIITTIILHQHRRM